MSLIDETLNKIQMAEIRETLLECAAVRKLMRNLTFEKGITKENGRPYYRTWMGVHFFPLDVNHHMINYWDICHGLSIIRRYHGHLDVGVSTGNHTLFMLEAAPKWMHRAIFLHDAAESYYNDLASPLKHSLIKYCKLEDRCSEIIHEKYMGNDRFGINLRELKKWDLASLAAEVRSFSKADWWKQIPEKVFIKKKLKLRTDKQVEKELLKHFRRLFPQHWLGASYEAFLSRFDRVSDCK